MDLRPIRSNEIELVAGWLSEKRNSRWLDFGPGKRAVEAVDLQSLILQETHAIRVYTADEVPIGVVGLANISDAFRTATAWAVLGRKEYGMRDLTVRALSQLLRYGFEELGLGAVNAWVVEINRGGIRLFERLYFRLFGRQRRCHYIRGIAYDRLWYDLLREEYRGFQPLDRRG